MYYTKGCSFSDIYVREKKKQENRITEQNIHFW